MTISTTIIKSSASGNGSTTAFTYSFKIAAETEVQVIVKTNATGAESVRSIGTGSTNYAVTGVGNNSGTVTFVTAPLSSETVVLRRSTAQTQGMDLIENDPLPANTLETAIDKNLAISQELQEQIDRSLKISRANTMTSTEFITSATDRASKILAFDSSGELSVTQELGTYEGTSATTTTAAFVVRDIVKGSTTAQLNNIYICIQASPIGTALTNTSYWVLIVDAVSAASSATASAASATTATTKATAAASSATASESSATAAASSATAGASSATAAASSATAAAASFDAFDDIYLGAKSSDPSADNDGDSLTTGDQYFNTSSNQLKIYNGSAWQVAAISSTGVVTLTGTETLTNKTLTAPILSGSASSAGSILFKEDTDNGTNSVTLKGAAATADVTVTLPAAADTLVGKATTDTLTNKTFDLGGTGNSLTGSLGEFNTALQSESFVGLAATQTLTNKTLTSPKINEDVAVTSTATELNLLDGVSGLVQADLTKLASVNATAAEINYSDLATLGTSAASKVLSADANNLSKITGAIYIEEATLTYDATQDWDVRTSPVAKVVLTNNVTFDVPSNPTTGQFISIVCIQDGTGSRTIAWNAIFEFATDTAPVATTTASKGDMFNFRYNGAKWLEVGRNLALTLS